MDIFAHTLWTGILAIFVNQKNNIKKRLNISMAIFWGLFPDLFAFTIQFLFVIINLFSGRISMTGYYLFDSIFRSDEPVSKSLPLFDVSHLLYGFSHSLIVFLLVFFIISLFYRKFVWVMLGWLLHIFIDIPTHNNVLYQTPIFWPISNWTFQGIAWSSTYFLVVNYLLLALIYSLFFLYTRRKKKEGFIEK
ncbi:MAG TPA: metal-dependent hydrolase [Candidatus Paceibacterota bacterium]|nr:metal-dependent hydrolase [Candidatus Paceibacterota bacterium]